MGVGMVGCGRAPEAMPGGKVGRLVGFVFRCRCLQFLVRQRVRSTLLSGPCPPPSLSRFPQDSQATGSSPASLPC